VKAIFLTVDSPVIGKREADEKVKTNDDTAASPMSNSKAGNDSKGDGIGRTLGQYIDPSFSWNDMSWLRTQTTLPIVLKGVQTAADAKIAMDFGIEAIMLSNHGGRSLDT
jgi:L-lactate dehydrogenase (cytochrome)